MRAPGPVSRVAAIILAAGASTRLGEPKQLAQVAGEALLTRAIRVAAEAGCDPLVVVLGASASRIIAECPLPPAKVIINENWSEGMASSIRLGVQAVLDQVDAVIIMTCDQPSVTARHLHQLMQANAGPIASSYAGRQGVPACFPVSRFDDLLHLEGDRGARMLLQTCPAVALSGGELDIDTAQSLELARAIYGSSKAPAEPGS
jgi:molybdenum cofactor cytidylyltransferase